MSDFTVEVEREEDGRWISEIPDLHGVMTYGASRDEAVAPGIAAGSQQRVGDLPAGGNVTIATRDGPPKRGSVRLREDESA